MPQFDRSRGGVRGALPLALILLAALVTGCAGLQSLEPPEVSVVSLKPVAATLMEQRFEVGLRVLNPNNRDIDVKGLDFELDINGSRLARGVTAEEFTLPRLGETVATVDLTTSTLDIIQRAMTLSNGQTLEYRLRGRVHLGGLAGTLPFDETGQISMGQNGTTTL